MNMRLCTNKIYCGSNKRVRLKYTINYPVLHIIIQIRYESCKIKPMLKYQFIRSVKLAAAIPTV